MKSVVVKNGVAYFNIGYGDGNRLPRDGGIGSEIMNCRKRTNNVGIYVPSPKDHERWASEGKAPDANQRWGWDKRYNKRLVMVCPADITSKDFKEAKQHFDWPLDQLSY